MKKKLESETHLNFELLVKKSHPRIIFRGKLDSLLASFILAQKLFKEMSEDILCSYFEEIYEFIRKMIYAEATNTPFKETKLFSLDFEDIRKISHNPKKYFGIEHLFHINATMPITVLTLNQLRTQSRELELNYILMTEKIEKELHLVGFEKALNRLSSAIYILMCIYASGKKEIEIL